VNVNKGEKNVFQIHNKQQVFSNLFQQSIMAAAVIYLSLALLLTPQTVVVAADLKAAVADAKPAPADLKPSALDAKPAATDLKAAEADAKPFATDLKAAALDAKPAIADLKAAAADLKTAAVDRCPPGVGQFLSLNGRQYQKEARILIKTRRKKGRLFYYGF
jgi:hypothetical protein